MPDVTARPNLGAIKPVQVDVPAQSVTMYQIPITQEMPLADGSGTAVVVIQNIQITKEQLQNTIDMASKQIVDMQAQVDDAKAKLDAINAIGG